MDDIIKLLQQLIEASPKPKGGIASSQEGVEFLGKALTKEQRGKPFTLESCDARIAETQAMIDAGKLPAALGNMLIRIPKKAKERLLTGQTPDTKNE